MMRALGGTRLERICDHNTPDSRRRPRRSTGALGPRVGSTLPVISAKVFHGGQHHHQLQLAAGIPPANIPLYAIPMRGQRHSNTPAQPLSGMRAQPRQEMMRTMQIQ